jgi:hypothetical protein
MVLTRDVSESVIIRDQPATFIALVLDVETGLILGASPGASAAEATHAAFTAALADAPPPLAPGPPGRILYTGEHIDVVNAQKQTLLGEDAPIAEKIIAHTEAEAVFDQLVQLLAADPTMN